jgi:hypothetical protein
VGCHFGEADARENTMSEIPKIVAAEAVIQGVLKIVWNDSYEGIVDLRGIIADGDLFAYIRKPENFKCVRVAKYGHSLFWGQEDNENVDFGSDRLREIAEQQAVLLAHAR